MKICYASRVRSEAISQVMSSRFVRPAHHSERIFQYPSFIQTGLLFLRFQNSFSSPQPPWRPLEAESQKPFKYCTRKDSKLNTSQNFLKLFLPLCYVSFQCGNYNNFEKIKTFLPLKILAFARQFQYCPNQPDSSDVTHTNAVQETWKFFFLTHIQLCVLQPILTSNKILPKFF